MAKKIRNIREKDLIAAVDIGGSKVACVIAQLTQVVDGELEADVIGVGQHGGLAKERNIDVEAALRSAVEAAERMAGETVRRVYASIGGRSLSVRRIGVDLDIDGGVITTEDVEDCLSQGGIAATPEGSTLLHALPIRFTIDGEATPNDIAGLAGRVLGAEMLGVCVKDSKVENLEALLERCGLELEETIAAPIAAAESSVFQDEKDLGALLVDIGARSTEYALFEKGALVACGGVPVGGEHVTRDLAQIFGAPIASAERVKTLHGSAIVTSGDDHRFVDFPQLGAETEIARHTKAEVAGVITPRLEEILELTLEALPKTGVRRLAISRAVLTGGGSLLVGARETAERVLGVRTHLRRPETLSGAPDAATTPQFAVAVGLLKCVARERARRRQRPQLKLKIGSGSGNGGGRLLGGVGHWLRQNF